MPADSGWPMWNGRWPSRRTPPAMAARWPSRRLPPASQPREAFDYCNLCYDVAALAVARAAGEPYADFVRRRVLGPTGAKAAFVRPARFAAWPGVRTRGYRWVDGRADLNDAFDNEGFHGGGNIYFSARDLAAWGAAWADGGGLPPV